MKIIRITTTHEVKLRSDQDYEKFQSEIRQLYPFSSTEIIDENHNDFGALNTKDAVDSTRPKD